MEAYPLSNLDQIFDIILNSQANESSVDGHMLAVVMGVNLGICTTGGRKSPSCKFLLIPYRFNSILDMKQLTLILTIF